MILYDILISKLPDDLKKVLMLVACGIGGTWAQELLDVFGKIPFISPENMHKNLACGIEEKIREKNALLKKASRYNIIKEAIF